MSGILSRLRSNQYTLLLFFVFLLSIPVKLYAAQDLAWDIDFVPVVARGQIFFNGGSFPAYGTLSSVAAYNLPFLVWLQMPVMAFTRDVPTLLILTQLIWNFIGTWFLFKLGKELFSPPVGLIAAILFTFSETGISSAYTAWAQLLLPTFFILVLYSLFRWRMSGNGRYAVFTAGIATAAFMTHFSAVLLFPVLLIMVIVIHPPLKWRWILMGGGIVFLLVAPYLIFQVERNFVDLRAFLTRETIVSPEVLAQYNDLKPGALPVVADNTDVPPANASDERQVQSVSPTPQPSRIQGAIEWFVSIPGQVVDGIMLAFSFQKQSLQQHLPLLGAIDQILSLLLVILFWTGIPIALFTFFQSVRQKWRNYPDDRKSYSGMLQLIRDTLVTMVSGRYMLLLLFVLLIIAGLIVTRAGPSQQPTYYTGLFGIQTLMIAYTLYWLYMHIAFANQIKMGVVILLVVGSAGLGAAERIVRVQQRDYDRFTPLNVWRYQPIADAVAWIATDWNSTIPLTISYDIMPEVANLWWVAPWNTVDSSYRIGMSYDFLIESYYGLTNLNINPIGLAEDADYIVVLEPGLERYDLSQYTIERFNTIFVLKAFE